MHFLLYLSFLISYTVEKQGSFKQAYFFLPFIFFIDLSSKPEMSVEELENITVLLLSLNPRRYKMRELNLDDSRLTDEKLRTLAPLVVRFRTVKIGGKQDYGVKGLEELRLYMEQIKGKLPLLSTVL